MASYFNVENIFAFGGMASSYLLAKRSLNQSKTQHLANVDLSKRQHLMETFSELAQHFIQLDADLVNATRESERDVYDQRNQQLQALILSCTVMFAALSTIMVQGYLRGSSPNPLVISFSLCNGLSFACLVGCLVLCIEILGLTSRFMICKASYQSQSLWDARENTKFIFEKLGAKDFNIKPGKKSDTGFKNIARVGEEDIERLWKELEAGSSRILNDRQKLIGRMVESESFDNFWRNHCDRDRVHAVVLFYMGTIFMLFSIICYNISQFYIGYHSVAGACAGSIIIFLSLIEAMRQKWYIMKIRPESYFLNPGDTVEVAVEETSYFHIYYRPEKCTWRECKVITPAVVMSLVGSEVKETMKVQIIEDGSVTDVRTWQVRLAIEQARPPSPTR
jgi:hypothetical protein